ncbi:MAG: hypothetical protein ACI9TH_001179 [Kiritimatiellia bacterium]|jgi:hypothetical protein
MAFPYSGSFSFFKSASVPGGHDAHGRLEDFGDFFKGQAVEDFEHDDLPFVLAQGVRGFDQGFIQAGASFLGGVGFRVEEDLRATFTGACEVDGSVAQGTEGIGFDGSGAPPFCMIFRKVCWMRSSAAARFPVRERL